MMKNDITYEYRVFTDRLVDVESMEVGKCTSKVLKDLKSKDKVDGRFFHTSDTDEWFFCWNGKLQKLNLKGNADVNSALDEFKTLISNANKNASDAIIAANDAKTSSNKALEVADKIDSKADTSYVDEVSQTVSQVAELKANASDVQALSDKVDAIKDHYALKSDIPTDYLKEGALENYALKSDIPTDYLKEGALENYALKSDIKEPITYTAGSNIDIIDNKISAKGYTYNAKTNSFAEGNGTKSTGNYSHAEGNQTTASGNYSHAEGNQTIASANQSHAEGFGTKAYNNGAHAEGDTTTAYGCYSHVEGANSVTGYDGEVPTENTLETPTNPNSNDGIGGYAHAEGAATLAIGKAAHSEGSKTFASGDYSHAEGDHTIAKNISEHAEGHFNLSNKNSDEYGDSLNTQHSIGVGTDSNNRKNAFEVMQNGDAYLIGVGEYDGTNPNTSKTLQEVINGISGSGSVDTGEFVKESELADKLDEKGYVKSEVLDDYAKTEVLKGYATTDHNHDESYAKLKDVLTQDDLAGLATEDYVDQEITKIQNSSYDDTEIKNQLATKADKAELFSGSYSDLTDKPDLFSGSYNDLTDKPDLFSGSYNDLTDKPTIPSIDDLASIDYVDSLVKDSEGKSLFDAAGAAKQALADAKADAAEKYQVKGNYLTEHQDISGKQDVIDDLDEIRVNAKLAKTALQVVPDEYVTETKLAEKGYLTDQSLDNYYTKSEVYTQAKIDEKIQAINDLIGSALTLTNTILNA